jgi:mannose-6-phosphate isomerase-like protein (cupin superfamily)
MPKISKQQASNTESAPGYEGAFEDLGGYTVAFETYTEDADMAPLFVGLPDDRCQCPHWGFVLRGKVTYHYADSSDTIEAGDAYFAPPGHTPELHAGTELVEFSPTAELERTLEVVLRNVAAAEAQG